MTDWRTVERPSALSVQPRAQVVGDIPDAHVITVRERRVTVDYPTVIQNNVNTDIIELDLDGEWDDMSVVLVLGPCGGATELAWHGEPVTLPSALAEDTGGIDVSVVGYSADGETRLVTIAAPSLLSVIKSGCTVGEAPAEETPDLIGQLVAAGDAANKAAKAANTAATAANGAAGTANAAASAANTAAGKASTAAAEATNAASAATDAAGEATRAAQSADAAAQAASAAAEAARGNVLKGALGPAPLLSADDAYATKPRELTVNGETRQNLWANPSGSFTRNGVTVTPNSDGSVTINGTSTSSNLIEFEQSYALRPGTQYTVSVDKLFPMNGSDSSGGFYIQRHISGQPDTTIAYLTSDSTGKARLDVPANTEYCAFGVQVTSGTTVSGTYRVMLNEGDTAEPWCPPGLNSVDELSIVTAGKNLLPADASEWVTSNNVSVSIDGDTVTVSSTSGTYSRARVRMEFLAGMTVHFGRESVSGGLPIMQLVYSVDGESYYITINSSPHAVPSCATNISIQLYCNNSTSDGAYTSVFTKPYLRVDGVAQYAPLSGFTTTPIDLDGHALDSLPDGTHDELTIDATGAVTLVKRVGVATAPSDASGWKFVDGRGEFNISDTSTSSQDDMTLRNLCDKLPVRKAISDPAYALASTSYGYAKHPSITGASTAASIAGGATYLYPLATPQEIDLPAVTLPTLPAPTVNVWADAEESGAGYAMDPDVELEYERDVTIAFDKLQAQVSATTVREATNG